MFTAEELQNGVGKPPDLIIRPLAGPDGLSFQVVFLSTVCDADRIDNLLINPMQSALSQVGGTAGQPVSSPKPLSNPIPSAKSKRPSFAKIAAEHPALQHLTVLGEWSEIHLKKMANQLFAGHCLLILEQNDMYLSLDVSRWSQRSITTPETESSLIGPRDAFVENITDNLSMIRSRIRHEHLTAIALTIGEATKSQVYVLYMKGLARPDLIDQVRARLDNIKGEGFLDTSQLGQLVLDKPKWFTPFPLMQSTERPDKTVASLLEGRIVIMMNTSPTAVVLPVTMNTLYQTADDYYFPSVSGTFLRLVRFIGLIMTLFLPALYVAITSVNQDVLRIQFMIAIAASREGVPYPAFIEVMVMMTLLELINEATVRLPKVIGGTATIVGGLIIGTAAAQAHLISNIMIVITAATAIGSYTIPNYMLGVSLRICSYVLVMFSIIWGLYGMTVGMAIIFLYLCSLKSMDVPYLAPYSTFVYTDLLRDALIRAPKALFMLRSRTYRVKRKLSRSTMRKEGDKLL